MRNREIRSTSVATAVLPSLPMTRSPSQCPGTCAALDLGGPVVDVDRLADPRRRRRTPAARAGRAAGAQADQLPGQGGHRLGVHPLVDRLVRHPARLVGGVLGRQPARDRGRGPAVTQLLGTPPRAAEASARPRTASGAPAPRTPRCPRPPPGSRSRPPCRPTSREITDESRPSRRPISLYCKPSARPREISSRSANINIARTAGILSHRAVKIKCYDRLSPRGPPRLPRSARPSGRPGQATTDEIGAPATSDRRTPGERAIMRCASGASVRRTAGPAWRSRAA